MNHRALHNPGLIPHLVKAGKHLFTGYQGSRGQEDFRSFNSSGEEANRDRTCTHDYNQGHSVERSQDLQGAGGERS